MMKKTETTTQVYEAVEQLWTYSHLTPENYTAIKKYLADLEEEKDLLKFLLKHNETNKPQTVENRLAEIEAELVWFEENARIYRNTRIAIHDMSCYVRNFWMKTDDEYYDAFFDMKYFVEMVNCYFDVKNPYKAPNKIAYGWNFALDKGFQAFRPYFYACIRNYLQKNDVEFKVIDLQKICCLKDITDEDC